MKKNTSLEAVSLTAKSVEAWIQTVANAILAAQKSGVPVDPNKVGEEYGEVDDETGILTIKCQFGEKVVTLDVPKGQWAWTGN